jgi:N-acyl-D-aspartate/D-glutamate deacylase
VVYDAGTHISQLVHWVRHRTGIKQIPLEYSVKRQTPDTAQLYGLLDRGTLAPPSC